MPLALVLANLLAGQPESKGLLSDPTLWRVINLLVFAAALVYLLRNKIGIAQKFDSRAASIVKELDQARREKGEAEEKLAEIEARFARLDQETAEIRAAAEREGREAAARIADAAQADAEKIRQTALREIDGAMKAARAELRELVAEESVKLAEQMIRNDIKPEDNSRLFTKFVDDLREVKR